MNLTTMRKLVAIFAISFLTLGTTSAKDNSLSMALLTFEAHLNGDQVDLNWNTSPGTESDYFAVERSSDRKTWYEVVRVGGSAGAAGEIDYFDIDRAPIEGISYYRLKQINADGGITYSSAVAVEIDENGKPGMNIWPKSAHQPAQVAVELKGFRGYETLVVIRNEAGDEFYSKVVIAESDSELIAIDPENTLPTGTYLITASSNNKIYSRKLYVKK